MSEDKQMSVESCLYVLSILHHQYLLIIYILHNCRNICCVPVCVKYNQCLPRKETEHWFEDVCPALELEKSGKGRISR